MIRDITAQKYTRWRTAPSVELLLPSPRVLNKMGVKQRVSTATLNDEVARKISEVKKRVQDKLQSPENKRVFKKSVRVVTKQNKKVSYSVQPQEYIKPERFNIENLEWLEDKARVNMQDWAARAKVNLTHVKALVEKLHRTA